MLGVSLSTHQFYSESAFLRLQSLGENRLMYRLVGLAWSYDISYFVYCVCAVSVCDYLWRWPLRRWWNTIVIEGSTESCTGPWDPSQPQGVVNASSLTSHRLLLLLLFLFR